MKLIGKNRAPATNHFIKDPSRVARRDKGKGAVSPWLLQESH